MEGRVSATGEKPAPNAVWDAHFDYLQSHERSLSGAWTELGPIQLPANGTGQPNGLGRVNGIGFHPTDANIIWLAAPSGGLWKTTDGGSTWSSNTDDLPTLGVSSILIDPNDTNIMYIGTGDRDGGDAPGLGVMKSTDGGGTWNLSNSGMDSRVVGMMLMHPGSSSTILAATSGGVYKSIDSGVSWTLKSNTSHYKDIRFKPGDPSIVYATASGDFYRSTDTGMSLF